MIGVATRDDLLTLFRLENLFNTPLPPHPPRKPNGHTVKNTFNKARGREAALDFVQRQNDYLINQLGPKGAEDFHKVHNYIEVIVLGKKVWESFGLRGDASLFSSVRSRRWYIQFYRFPHPSGLNHQLNDPEILQAASQHLKRIAGITS